MKILNKGFNYSQDGPGNRLVYHLQGCNFACKWCSNADSIPLENPKAKECSVKEVFDEIILLDRRQSIMIVSCALT